MVVNKEMGRTYFPTIYLEEQMKATRNLGLNLMFVDPCIIVQFLQRKPQQDATVYQNFIIPYFK
jgi:hypothetical protein